MAEGALTGDVCVLYCSGCLERGDVRPSPPGPLIHSHPEWKGMEPRRRCLCRTDTHPYPRPSIATRTLWSLPARLLLLLFLTTLALASASGFSLQQNSQCQIDQCWDQFTEAKDTLELSDTGADNVDLQAGSPSHQEDSADAAGSHDNNEAHCVALRTYWNCIKGTKGCQGNIRFYSVRNGVLNQMKQYNCTLTGRTVPSSISQHQEVPPSRPVPTKCRYQGNKQLRHCGLFGDPHLRTFTDQFQTCRVKGAWPLVNNDYLTVQVTNDPVVGGNNGATATSKLTVIVKSHAECGSSQYHTYQAQTDSLPSAFEDGNTSFGPYGSIQLVEVEPNRHVEIHVIYIHTTIILRQIGRYFTFAIHMPEELVNASSSGSRHQEPELCTKGCPASEQIDYKRYLAQRRDRLTQLRSQDSSTRVTVTRSEAEEVCRKAGLVDFYFDSCVFDLLATGDSDFTLAALSALKDVLKLDPAKAVHSSRSTLEPYDQLFNAALPQTVSLWVVAAVCTLSVLLTWGRGVWSVPGDR